MPNFAIYFGIGFLYLLVGAGSGPITGPLLIWGGVSLSLIGLGYSGMGPNVFGKRLDGTMSPLNVILLLPYLFFARVTWYLRRFLSKEPCCNEIAPGVWLGRRPVAQDLPDGVTMVVDLTAEFEAIDAVKSVSRYLCVPTLDGCAPADREFLIVLEELANWQGPVYIHCAHGHGRSAIVAVALMKVRGFASSVDEALSMVQKIRPKVNLKGPQRKLLDKWESGLLTSGPKI